MTQVINIIISLLFIVHQRAAKITAWQIHACILRQSHIHQNSVKCTPILSVHCTHFIKGVLITLEIGVL